MLIETGNTHPKRRLDKFKSERACCGGQSYHLDASSSEDSLFSESVLNEIIGLDSAFSFEDLGFFNSQGSLLDGLEDVVVKDSIEVGWEKRGCGWYRSGWTGDGV